MACDRRKNERITSGITFGGQRACIKVVKSHRIHILKERKEEAADRLASMVIETGWRFGFLKSRCSVLCLSATISVPDYIKWKIASPLLWASLRTRQQES